MPRTVEQYEEIRENKRKIITEAALNVFGRYGYHGSTISKLASEAKISKGLIYNYFKSKEEILIEIFNDGLEQMLGIFDPNKDGMLTQAEMKFFINKSFDFVVENRHYWSLYFGVMLQPDVIKLFEKKIQEVTEPFIKIMYHYFEKLGYEDPLLELRYFGALMDGIALNFILDPDRYPLDALRKRVINTYTKKVNKD